MSGICHPYFLFVGDHPDAPAVSGGDPIDLGVDSAKVPAGAAQRLTLEMAKLTIFKYDKSL
jgi:hypothetical protein